MCKHVAAVKVWLAGQWTGLHERAVTVIKRPSPKCHYGCRKGRVVRDGHRPTKRKGTVQKYLCLVRNRRFYGLRKLKGHHAPTGVMADGLSLASKGMSPSGVAQELARKGHRLHRSAIYRWAAKCGPLMDAHAKKFSPWGVVHGFVPFHAQIYAEIIPKAKSHLSI